MVLQKCNQHTRRCDNGIVERMRQVGFSVLTLDANSQATGLSIRKVGTGADFKIFFQSWGPGLNVAGFDLQICQIAGTAFQLSDRNLHAAEQLYGKTPHFFIPGHGIFRSADNDHFLFLKLMNSIDSTLFNAMSTLLLSEAGRLAGQSLRELIFC